MKHIKFISNFFLKVISAPVDCYKDIQDKSERIGNGFHCEDTGAVFIYEKKQNSEFHLAQYISAPLDGKHSPRFAHSIAVSGSYLIVGAPHVSGCSAAEIALGLKFELGQCAGDPSRGMVFVYDAIPVEAGYEETPSSGKSSEEEEEKSKSSFLWG